MGDDDITGLITCFVLVLYGTLGLAWILLFKLWARHFHRKSLSSVHQLMKLFGWVLLLAFVVFYSLWAFGSFVPF